MDVQTVLFIVGLALILTVGCKVATKKWPWQLLPRSPNSKT